MSMPKYKHIMAFEAPILKFSLPQKTIDAFNKFVDGVEAKGIAGALDYSDHLAGKVSQEIVMPESLLKMHSQVFFSAMNDYVQVFYKNADVREGNAEAKRFYNEDNERLQFTIKSGWFVRSFAGDYNPVHHHPGCDLSAAGFLKLPEWDDEVEEDEEDHIGLTNGCLQFINGINQTFSNNTHTIKPKVGDFYLFPSWLPHCVYPFKSSGERRSFSMNYLIYKS